jgi:hypothetical protein
MNREARLERFDRAAGKPAADHAGDMGPAFEAGRIVPLQRPLAAAARFVLGFLAVQLDHLAGDAPAIEIVHASLTHHSESATRDRDFGAERRQGLDKRAALRERPSERATARLAMSDIGHYTSGTCTM